jgi:hypothetical protein
VSQLLKDNHFNVLTRWERVPNTVRYYAVILVQQPQGPVYLADLLVRRGYARVGSVMTELPDDRRDQATYLAELRRLDEKARQGKAGIWAKSSSVPGVPGTKADAERQGRIRKRDARVVVACCLTRSHLELALAMAGHTRKDKTEKTRAWLVRKLA